MVTIKIEKIEMKEALKNKIEFICSFSNTTPTIYNENIKIIEHTNLNYVKPHRIIIKDITFLAFNYENTLYIENLSNAIPLNNLEQYIKSMKINKFTKEFKITESMRNYDGYSYLLFNEKNKKSNDNLNS